jgi:GTP cyclohydrolase I
MNKNFSPDGSATYLADQVAVAEIRRKLAEAHADFRSSANVSAHIGPGDLEAIEETVRGHVAGILEALLIDPRQDHNTEGTASRVARMFVREAFAGRFTPRPELTDFPNAERLDELYTVGPIAIRSTCAHHLAAIEGEAWVGVIPSRRLIGLSKFERLAAWVFARPHIQEEATVMLADEIEQAIEPRGLGLVVKARHGCMSWRGVKNGHTSMTTSILRGIVKEGPAARQEFYSMIAAQGFACRS